MSNTQGGFVPGTAALPATGAGTGFSFGGIAAGAGDANKAATPGLAQTQSKPDQLFATSFGAPKFGGTPAGAPTFGASSLGLTGFGTPATGTTGFGAVTPATTGFSISQPKTLGSNLSGTGTAPAASGGLTFGTPIGTSAAATSQPVQLGFQTPSSQPTNLGLGTVPTSSTTPGFNFSGNPATTTSALAFNLAGAPATSGTLSTGGVSFGTPNLNISSTAATTSGGLAGLSFGTPAASAPTSGFSLAMGGTSTAPSTGSGATVGTTPSLSTPGGFNLSGAPTQTPQSSATSFNLGGTTTATLAPAATAFNLGTATSGSSFTTGMAAPTTTAPAFNLGGPTPAASAPGFTLGKSVAPAASTAPTSSAPQTSLGTTTNVTASATATSQPSGLNFCQLEEAINKWTLELEEQEKAFVNQATQVNAWDRLLIANGEKIVTLNEEVERVKLEQQQLEHELDYVVGQQRELQDCLVPLEKELGSVTASDPEREYTYRLAENLDTQLKQMSEDLKEIIEHLNEANRSQDSSDPIVQIGKILNAHMNSLQWLDQRTAVLQTKIQQIDQMHQNFRQEHERSFSLAYN